MCTTAQFLWYVMSTAILDTIQKDHDDKILHNSVSNM